MSVEISEGRVTNYVLSTLSAVLLLFLLSTSENVAFLLDRLLFYFLYFFCYYTTLCSVFVFDFVFLVGATVK